MCSDEATFPGGAAALNADHRKIRDPRVEEISALDRRPTIAKRIARSSNTVHQRISQLHKHGCARLGKDNPSSLTQRLPSPNALAPFSQ